MRTSKLTVMYTDFFMVRSNKIFLMAGFKNIPEGAWTMRILLPTQLTVF